MRTTVYLKRRHIGEIHLKVCIFAELAIYVDTISVNLEVF